MIVNEGGVVIELGGLEVSEDGATISISSSTGADALAVDASSKYGDLILSAWIFPFRSYGPVVAVAVIPHEPCIDYSMS